MRIDRMLMRFVYSFEPAICDVHRGSGEEVGCFCTHSWFVAECEPIGKRSFYDRDSRTEPWLISILRAPPNE